ncbi:NodT family efflux transporter outer membrane factor (OMF) lipoprotein [Trinickia symbiotica]|uniref:RND transporter n=1 Tax=Trinickia symbiotica TaxID=863227 RepID=A0A2N7X504_9BURK|nr:efflux transporter outer membrane subunit [Trinickia symbiotica]PMS36651.1 RND transporter [Trinickia symbiotica]PPK46078.1 NodT family efflux transporter outer membrane factor (OMF) lipoprotein [Trinickia symbiotica]
MISITSTLRGCFGRRFRTLLGASPIARQRLIGSRWPNPASSTGLLPGRRTGRWPTVAVGLVALMLAGCAAGPDYVPPLMQSDAAFVRTPVVFPQAGSADPTQHAQSGAEIIDRWWTSFRSAQLDDTVSLAFAQSPTLDTARATLKAAQEAILAARGGLYPQLDLAASAERSRTRLGGGAAHAVSNLIAIGPTVSYDIDFFGGVRRQVEAQTALAEYQHDQLAATYLALTGNTVIQALTAASAREQLRAVDDIVAVDRRNLELVGIERQVGRAAQSDVLAARSQLAADLALAPPLEQQLAAADHALAILVGKTPAQWQAPQFDFDMLALPIDVPVMLPSAWLLARPDIRAAQAQLHAASAQIGVATARLYPNITLTASWAQVATSMGPLFESANGLWSVAAALTAPLFHGGALKAQQREAIDVFDAQLGVYRQTVLEAFGQVADTLRALEHDAQALAAEREAFDTAQASLRLVQESYRIGTATSFDILQAQRLYAQARLGYARAKGQRYVDTAQLFVAMGGAAQAWAERDSPGGKMSASGRTLTCPSERSC